MRAIAHEYLLSLLCGVALLLVVRFAYALGVVLLPDVWLMDGLDPLARLAFARLLLFAVLTAVVVLPLSWPLARHAATRSLHVTFAGAACAAALFLLLESMQPQPFPRWLGFAQAAVLFTALPLGVRFWWRRH